MTAVISWQQRNCCISFFFIFFMMAFNLCHHSPPIPPPQVPFTCNSIPAGTTMCGERLPPQCTTSLWASCGLTRFVYVHLSLVSFIHQSSKSRTLPQCLWSNRVVYSCISLLCDCSVWYRWADRREEGNHSKAQYMNKECKIYKDLSSVFISNNTPMLSVCLWLHVRIWQTLCWNIPRTFKNKKYMDVLATEKYHVVISSDLLKQSIVIWLYWIVCKYLFNYSLNTSFM